VVDITIFQEMGQHLDTTLNPFIEQTVGETISTFSLFFIGFATIHLTMMGYAVGWGYVELPFATFMKTCAKYLFIGGLALNAGTYTEWIVGSIQSLETGFTAAFASTSSGSSTSVYETVDQALGKGWGVAGDLVETANNRGFRQLGVAISEYIYAAIIAIATGLIAIPAGGMIVVAKAALTIMLGIGPVFLMLLLWPATAKFFDSWLGQTMTYILRIALVAATLGLAFKGFEGIIDNIDLDGDQSTFLTCLVLLTFTKVMFLLLAEVNNVAGQLAGGISSAAITLRGMAQGAAAPLSMAGRMLNSQSMRRDMRTGMMTTGSRFQHFKSGNTMANPAYRQYAKNSGGTSNWGRAKPQEGGTVKG